MNQNKPAQLMPMLEVESVDRARAFYVDALGFDHMMGVVGADGALDFLTVHKSGAKIMLMRPEGPAESKEKQPASIYFEVDGVDEYHAQLKAKGLSPTDPENMWWGDRVFILSDPFGYRLWFYQNVSEPVPPEGLKIV